MKGTLKRYICEKCIDEEASFIVASNHAEAMRQFKMREIRPNSSVEGSLHHQDHRVDSINLITV